MALLTWEEMHALHGQHPEAGITFMKAYDYFEAPEIAQTSLTEEKALNEFGMKGFRFHSKDELPEGVQLGYEYDTWCVNPMVYCAFLLRRFAYRGGKIREFPGFLFFDLQTLGGMKHSSSYCVTAAKQPQLQISATDIAAVKREIRDPLEVFELKELAPFDVLINASGIGFGDHDVFITTGEELSQHSMDRPFTHRN